MIEYSEPGKPIGLLDDQFKQQQALIVELRELANKLVQQAQTALDTHYALEAERDYYLGCFKEILELPQPGHHYTAVETKVIEIANKALQYDELEWQEL